MHQFKSFLRLSTRAATRHTARLLALVALSPLAMADSEVNTGHFGNVAIKGYDPVAYFTEREAMEGSAEHTLKWLGANWRFVSEDNKRIFAADPQRYAPQYGGHCATGLAIHGGLTKDIDPEAWAIIDGKLYLNYSKLTNELLTGGRVSAEKADTNWNKHQRAESQ
ncbi:MAG: YHS domain-containing (seleno)protein [Gammaproteobacteria bacterium]|nr:YHS domain-containing (seleno)protein [Gammaproteobacteria bacterium]